MSGGALGDRAALTEQARRIGELLEAGGMTLAAAESCTGGLISSLITDIPGSSRWFKGAVVAYANEIKERLLGVSEAVLRDRGAVSREAVLAMAAGVLQALGADAAVAVSGIAGPDGGTADKPVGTVHVAWIVGGSAEAREFRFPGGRCEVKLQSAAAALGGLVGRLERAAAAGTP